MLQKTSSCVPLGLGFNATVVKVNTKVFNGEWLGRELNNQFYDDITKLKNVDPCGEGAYTTHA